MFVIIYQPSDSTVDIKDINNELVPIGQWKVDTDENGKVETIEDLATALSRVKDIRSKGGEACLGVIIE